MKILIQLLASNSLVFKQLAYVPDWNSVRVVLDTNILISACWTPGGLEHRTVLLALEKTITACTTEAIWDEYRTVLGRPKFDSRREIITSMLSSLERCSLVLGTAGLVITVAKDPDDNRFLECAEVARAQYLITGNLRDYPTAWKNTRVVHAREFLNITGQPGL